MSTSPAVAPAVSDGRSSSFVFGEAALRLSLDVALTRGPLVESVHRVHAAVVHADGRLLHAARDPLLRTLWRSCAKPFQLLPLVADGGVDRLGWGETELALACASHGGEPEHVALAESMLRSIGLDEDHLICGPHEPLSSRGADLLRASGRTPSRLHNNCSGKHSAMLARAVQQGWTTAEYGAVDHPVQVAARDVVAHWAALAPTDIDLAVDGCGVVVFALPLAHMALSYARLVQAASRGDDAPSRIVQAMTTHPFLVGGTERFDTLLMEAFEGRVLCKIGAEGVHTLALVHDHIGIALKVEDGGQRAQYHAVLALLAHLGVLPTSWPAGLRVLISPDILNTRGDRVGAYRIGAAPLGTRV